MMQTNRHQAEPLPPKELEPLSPIDQPKIGICQISDDEQEPPGHESQDVGYSTLTSELERSKRALYKAQERIEELTNAQFALSGTVGRLTEQALTDALTGLSNRRRFLEALKAEFQFARGRDLPLSVLMIDVDSFKSYNDTFGHSAGDHVIWVVAKLLLRNSGGEHVVARYGGEEFAILLPKTDASMAIEHAERQRACIESYPWPNRKVTASFGISTMDGLADDPGMMVEEADRALYHSKSRGRNRVTHHQSIDVPSMPQPHSDPENQPPVIHEDSSLRTPVPETSMVAHPDHSDKSSLASPHVMAWPTPRENAAPFRSNEPAWEALERFIQGLQGGAPASARFHEVLSAVREATEAEIVFLCNDATGEILGALGDQVPRSQWYHQLTRTIAEELPTGGIWRPSESSRKEANRVVPEPSAAIALPVKSPRPSWLVALRFRDFHAFSAADLRVVRVLWQLHVNHHRHDRVHDKLKETLFGVVRCLSSAIDAKDPYTCGHSERVARIAVRLGEEMRLGRGEISDLYLGGLLHDLGKIGIRDEVLCKEGPLTPDEFLHIKEHPVTGERIIANVTSLAYLRPGIRGHHERFDGKGYPDGLIGEAIPQMARILAVADSCDAMMSVRRYRAALSEARIEQIFREGAGSQWDPRIVQHFLDCQHELYAVIQRGLGQSVYIAVERAVGAGETLNRGAQSLVRKVPAPLRNR